jgi:hypothetical protein
VGADKCRQIRAAAMRCAHTTAGAEKSVKVIAWIQIGEYTRRKEYRFKQSSA